MARRIEIQINHEVYVGDTAPARDQVEMLQLAARTGLFPAMGKDVKDMSIFASVAAIEPHALEKLKELVLKKGGIVRASDNVPVSENLFQDEAHNFLLLLGKALKENIGPFWTLMGPKDEEGSDTMSKTESGNQN
ncbi:hypothetical protein ACLEYI_06135 [Enterobacter ludwigii]|uniref:hypothetical protein n=1 Tax=Enterobacter ludwigii TaxID=299767 RepID=UPI00397530FE